MNKHLFQILILVIMLLPLQAQASHNSYTGTNYNTCTDRCIEGHLNTFAQIDQCFVVCRTIVNNNKSKQAPVVTTPPPKPKKTHAPTSIPSTTPQAVYGYIINCLMGSFAEKLNVNAAISYCREDYSSRLSSHYLFKVVSCESDCEADGYGDCNAYCYALNQSYGVMSDMGQVNKAIEDWKKKNAEAMKKIYVMPDPSCSDKIQNQGETGVDCGGPCNACYASPPTSTSTSTSTPPPPQTPIPTCFDKIINQGEEGLDCGGPCKACETCFDNTQNQGEERADCGGPCNACLPIITFDGLPEEVQNRLQILKGLLNIYLASDDQDNAAMIQALILRAHKEAVEELGGDTRAYDIMSYLRKLEAEQSGMSSIEKQVRITSAKIAYYDLLADEHLYGQGKEGITKQAIEDKKEEIKAQYGRILLFDPNNLQANKALADIYDAEGRAKEAKVLYKKFLDNATKDSDTYTLIETKLKTYKKEISDDLNLPEPPSSTTSRVISSLKRSLSEGIDKTNLALYNQKMNAKVILESTTLSKDRKVLWERFNEFIFSFSPEKIEQLTGINNE